MDEATIRIAFTDWLRGKLERLVRPRPAFDHFLARSVDAADLEWRLRLIERGAPYPLFR